MLQVAAGSPLRSCFVARSSPMASWKSPRSVSAVPSAIAVRALARGPAAMRRASWSCWTPVEPLPCLYSIVPSWCSGRCGGAAASDSRQCAAQVADRRFWTIPASRGARRVLKGAQGPSPAAGSAAQQLAGDRLRMVAVGQHGFGEGAADRLPVLGRPVSQYRVPEEGVRVGKGAGLRLVENAQALHGREPAQHAGRIGSARRRDEPGQFLHRLPQPVLLRHREGPGHLTRDRSRAVQPPVDGAGVGAGVQRRGQFRQRRGVVISHILQERVQEEGAARAGPYAFRDPLGGRRWRGRADELGRRGGAEGIKGMADGDARGQRAIQAH
ncbi:hypothetical protein RKD37_002753 [Streptomyces ambofaciens]